MFPIELTQVTLFLQWKQSCFRFEHRFLMQALFQVASKNIFLTIVTDQFSFRIKWVIVYLIQNLHIMKIMLLTQGI